MKDNFMQLYQDQMRYLEISGEEMSQAYPGYAKYLGKILEETPDPYIERLLEGFAYQLSRCHEELNGGFDEFAQNILTTCFPHLAEGFPAYVLMQVKAKNYQNEYLPQGTLFGNKSSKSHPASVLFSTPWERRIFPFSITKANLDVRTKSLQIHFEMNESVNPQKIDLDDLEIFIGGDSVLAKMMMYYMIHLSKKVQLCSESGVIATDLYFNNTGIDAGRFSVPDHENALSACHLLRDFFFFRERFRFLGLGGMPAKNTYVLPQTFFLNISFEQMIPESFRPYINAEIFVMNVIPAFNIYNTQAEPVNLDYYRFEYPIFTDAANRDKVYRVLNVVGRDKEDRNVRTPYYPVFDAPEGAKNQGVYIINQVKDTKAGEMTLIKLISPENSPQWISLEVLATSGELARELIHKGDLQYIFSSNQENFKANSFSATNLTRPSRYYHTPEATKAIWRFLSAFSAGSQSFTSRNVLKDFLYLISNESEKSLRKILDKLSEVQSQPATFQINGLKCTGIQIQVVFKNEAISEHHQDEISDYHLFGDVLAVFFSHQISINQLFELKLFLNPLGKSWSWNNLPRNP